MNNWEFCAKWVVDQKPAKSVRVLDYGCGPGQIVQELRKLNVNAYGCDVFYEGGDYSSSIDTELLDHGLIKKLDGNNIPFDPSSFDFVINEFMNWARSPGHWRASVCGWLPEKWPGENWIPGSRPDSRWFADFKKRHYQRRALRHMPKMTDEEWALTTDDYAEWADIP